MDKQAIRVASQKVKSALLSQGSMPDTAIVLGSGLGGLVDKMQVISTLAYGEIPGFPVSTVAGHAGRLVFGVLSKRSVLVMQGRIHFYEGYDAEQVTFPIRVFAALGIKNLIVSNAAGGVNPDYKVGDLMLITDHINLFPQNPLRGPNDDSLGPRFPDMSEAYSKELRSTALECAHRLDIELRQGVYFGWQGPTFETPAEYRFIRTIGADAVGMSTVPEVIVARHSGMRVMGFSVITNAAFNSDGEASRNDHEDVQRAAAAAAERMERIVEATVNAMD